MGAPPTQSPDGKLVAFPFSDPVVAAASDGSFYATALAFDANGVFGDSEIAFYRMAPGERRLELVSTFADVGNLLAGNMADKEWLAIGEDGSGGQHFFVTWTQFSNASELPVMLSDSGDGLHWHTTRLSGRTNACDQGSQPVPVGPVLYVAWEHFNDCAAPPPFTGSEVVATVNPRNAKVIALATAGSFHGVGDTLTTCQEPPFGPTPREVIEPSPVMTSVFWALCPA
jgi:hypothetical protein